MNEFKIEQLKHDGPKSISDSFFSNLIKNSDEEEIERIGFE